LGYFKAQYLYHFSFNDTDAIVFVTTLRVQGVAGKGAFHV